NVLEEIGNSKRCAKSARGVRRAQIIRKHALPDYSDDPADQNTGADHHRVPAGAFTFTRFEAWRAWKASGRFADYGNGFSRRLGGIATDIKSFRTISGFGRRDVGGIALGFGIRKLRL